MMYPFLTLELQDAQCDTGGPAHLAIGPSSSGWSGKEGLGPRARHWTKGEGDLQILTVGRPQ